MTWGRDPYQEEKNHMDYEQHLSQTPQEQSLHNPFDPQVGTVGNIWSRCIAWVARWIVSAQAAGKKRIAQVGRVLSSRPTPPTDSSA